MSKHEPTHSVQTTYNLERELCDAIRWVADKSYDGNLSMAARRVIRVGLVKGWDWKAPSQKRRERKARAGK